MSDELISLIETKRDLPPIPEVLINLEKRVNDPDWDIIEISTIIETEPVLSWRLIQLSNSVLFGGGREKFVDVQGSIMRLGIKMVLDLAYTVLLIGVFRKPKDFNQFNFWTHSLGVVYLTRSLAHIVKISYEEIEFAYMCWLMHDVGILVIDHLIPDQYTELLESIKSTDRTLAEHEEETFGITHAELEKRFIERWWPVFPDMVQAIGMHHDDTGTDGNVKHIAHLLTKANLLANQNGFGSGIVPEDAAPLEYSLLNKLGLDFDELEILIENTKERLEAAQSILKGS